MPDQPLVKEADCKCPHCGVHLKVDVVKKCVTEPVQAAYETTVALREDPQGHLPLSPGTPRGAKTAKKTKKTARKK